MKIASYFLSRRTLVAGGTLACLVAMIAALAVNGFLGTTHSYAQTALPKPSHIVVVMEENHSYNEIINASSAPYINSLARSGASFTNSFAVAHPSEPNYLAFFSGSTQGITDDSCPHTFNPPDLGGELINAALSFKGYSEGLPSTGSTVCTSGSYARKHNPWSNFTDVPSSDNLPFTSFPTSNFSSLPTVSFVIPNLNDDMHDGTIQQGDTWLKNNIDAYVQWAKTNNSLLIVTWDEDDSSQSNQIPTIFVGPMVKAGQYSEHINHYNVLRTMEDMYGLPAANNSASATAIADCWQSGVTPTPTPNPSPTATPNPTPSPTPTPTPTPSPTPTTTPTPTPTPTPGGGNILTNGGFESGSSAWTESSSGGYEIVDSSNPHTGSNSAYLCGYNSCSDSIYQMVTMPSSATKVTLSYWLAITTTETSKTSCYDNFYARLRTSSGSTISTVQTRCNTNAQGWTQFTFDVTSALSSYKGQQIQVAFAGTNDYTLSSSFYVDDVALTAQ